MNTYRNTDKDIHQRIYRFVVNCFVNVVRKIPKITENLSIIGQLSDSLTSIGANDCEADAAGSKRDFSAKYMIVRKETKETNYWLSFVRDTQLLPADLVQPYIDESKEIQNIVSKILTNVNL